jgi:hypothetical protein
MASVPVPSYKQFWTDKRLLLNTQYKDLANTYPDATPSIQQLLKVLCDIENLANSTPMSVGESKEWAAIISSAEDNQEDYRKVLKWKTLFSALYGTYTVTLLDLKKIQKDSTQQEDDFKEVHRRKRHCHEEPTQTMKKVALPASTVKLAIKNFFAPSGQITWILILIIGLCILLRVLQLNTGRTSVRNKVFLVLYFIVHFSHYMFRPRLADIFRWFVNKKNISKAVIIY